MLVTTPDIDPRIHGQPALEPRPEFLLTSYMLGAPDGRNLGAAGYSHEFVARLFRPLLERWGRVHVIRDPATELQAAVADCRRQCRLPVHVSVRPFQDVCFAHDALNVVMPAWEFPDVPDHAFDGNPQNDWPRTADRADLVIVSGPFTAAALRRGGTKTPIDIVPVPTPEAYATVPPWTPRHPTTIGCRAFDFPSNWDAPTWQLATPPAAPETRRRGVGAAVRRELSRFIRRRRDQRCRRRAAGGDAHQLLPFPQVESLELTGIVYTSIFNPADGRKNWRDLLTGFLAALADRDDATLVLKLISGSVSAVEQVISFYLNLAVRHRCRVVFVCDFLADDQMLRLCEATTFYLQASKAEGNCLPLMNYLAAGRPGISPDHSSMGDYFAPGCGFVVDSHPEPSAWPHDPALRMRTTWGRIVWPSLRDQIRASHRLAATQQDYTTMADHCRDHMARWAGHQAVTARLDAALEGMFRRHLAAGPKHHVRRAA